MGSRCLRVRHDRAGLLRVHHHHLLWRSSREFCRIWKEGLWALFLCGVAQMEESSALEGQRSGRLAGATCHLFVVCSLFVLPLPLPSPLPADWCVSVLLCGGPRDNTHNGDLGGKRFRINRLRWLWLVKIFIALKMRLKHSGHKG